MNSLAICLLILSALPKSSDTVESVRQEWVKKFSQDPAGQVEIFHAPCIARPQCPDEEVYTLGIAQAAMETGHPVMWMSGGSSEDDPKYVLEKK
jgi:hypothetical protein